MQISATHPLHIHTCLWRGPQELRIISKPNNQSTLVVGCWPLEHVKTGKEDTRRYAIGRGIQDGCAKVIFIMCILLWQTTQELGSEARAHWQKLGTNYPILSSKGQRGATRGRETSHRENEVYSDDSTGDLETEWYRMVWGWDGMLPIAQ